MKRERYRTVADASASPAKAKRAKTVPGQALRKCKAMMKCVLAAVAAILCSPLLAACGDGRGDADDVRMDVPWATVAAEADMPNEVQLALLQAAGVTPALLADAGMPVLVPGDEDMLDRLEMNARSHLYVAYMRMPDYVLTVTGIRLKQPRESEPFEQHGNVGERRFYRWGTYYTVRVDCEITDAAPGDCDVRRRVDAITDDLILINPPD